jgi:hypothetical protein
MVYATVGDTIRLNAAFKAFDGTGTDPTTVTLTVYDELRNIILTAGTSAGGVENGSTDGAYLYDYLTLNEGVHFYEFEGTLETHTISDKGTFYVTFA